MPYDIILDETGDLKIENGHFVIGESTAQHQKCLLLAQKGDYREHPHVGVGIANYLNDDDLADVGFEIQKQYELDGMKIKTLQIFQDGSTNIDAKY